MTALSQDITTAVEEGKQAAAPYCLLTLKEASEVTSISVAELKRMILRGTMPAWKPSPHVLRIPLWKLVEVVTEQLGHIRE